jgi:DNA-binding MarR family transcriptional regulator
MNITVALRTLALDANRRVGETLAPLGLTFCQYTLLDAIDRYPNIHGTGAAKACGITPQTGWTGIANLIASGYIANGHERGMGRVNPLTITDAGRAVLEKARRAMNAMDNHYDDLLNVSNSPIDIAGEVAFVANNIKTLTKD